MCPRGLKGCAHVSVRVTRVSVLISQIKTALSVLTTMQDGGVEPDEVIYRSLLEACGRCGSTIYAAKVLAEVQRANIQPDR